MSGVGNNLKRIRLLKNWSLNEAGMRLNMSATAVSKYEKGLIQPDSKKLIQFANAYGVNALDLLREYDVPKMQFNSFRKKKRLTGQRLQLLEELIQNDVAKYLEVIEMSQVDFRNFELKKFDCNKIDDAEQAARQFREYIGISNIQPISDLINILENLGIVIIQIDNVENIFNDFDGLSEIVNEIPIIVILNDIIDGARQRFTIAHELGHLILNIKNKSIDEEKMCNCFASALLMPKEAVINEFGDSRKNINFFELTAFKKEYKVSYTAIIYRLKDLNIITEYLYKKLSVYLSKIKLNKVDPRPITPEVSYQFKRMVYKLEANEIISLNKACELLGVSISAYNKEDNNNRY